MKNDFEVFREAAERKLTLEEQEAMFRTMKMAAFAVAFAAAAAGFVVGAAVMMVVQALQS